MKTVTVSVTAEDIDHGIRASCRSCPVAKAIARHTSEGWDVEAGVSLLNVSRTDGSNRFQFLELPKIATGFICKFDGGENVSPFSLPLELPVSVLR